ncbi:uncharacterized protein NESG_02117 [Nematocida ausubeli]|uniref:Mitochondrial import receptor subunit TOM70 n=1 Tax=Nematocida ausubeli (strain ATCC PRA-371 / ERTm2) TaxID=1913371 RepID=A0A086IZM7_NEMA1|nr:uncharacterized protein NESG_02117 [Nematocida ausubeli]KAI5149841.1 hypothetical protein NEAUS05_1926 [Nematocida ausubeli]KFG25345.1 hypothetical protein NESG_02117 [Nematocida ausubeli]
MSLEGKPRSDIMQWVACGATISAILYGVYRYAIKDKSTPESMKEEGTAAFLLKDYASAMEKYMGALELIDRLESEGKRNKNSEERIKILNNISQTYFMMKDYENAKKYIEYTISGHPTHYNSFKRLAKLEQLDKGYGDVKGLAVITAYLILDKAEKDRSKESSTAASSVQTQEKKAENHTDIAVSDIKSKEVETERSTWNEVLSKKIEALAEKRTKSASTVKNGYCVSFVKLEEVLSIFKEALHGALFGNKSSKDKELLGWIDSRKYSLIVDYLNKTPMQKYSRRAAFIAGNIKYILAQNTEAISLFDAAGTIYGDVLSIYIKKLENVNVQIEEDKIIKIMNSNDPIVRMYVLQLHLASENMGHYMAKLIELQAEESISLPFISNIKSQYALYEHKEALSTLKKALSLFPEDINVLCTGVEVLSQEITKEKTEKEIDDAYIKQHPKCAEAYTMLVDVLSRLEQKEFGNSPRGAFFRYIGYSSLNQKEKAETLLQEAIDLDIYNNTLLIQLGQHKINAGDLSGFDLFEKAATLSLEGAKDIYRMLYTYKSVYGVQEYYPHVSIIAVNNYSAAS